MKIHASLRCQISLLSPDGLSYKVLLFVVLLVVVLNVALAAPRLAPLIYKCASFNTKRIAHAGEIRCNLVACCLYVEKERESKSAHRLADTSRRPKTTSETNGNSRHAKVMANSDKYIVLAKVVCCRRLACRGPLDTNRRVSMHERRARSARQTYCLDLPAYRGDICPAGDAWAQRERLRNVRSLSANSSPFPASPIRA